MQEVIKRDGRVVRYDEEKIAQAIFKAAKAVGGEDIEKARGLAAQVTEILEKKHLGSPKISDIQDVVQLVLIKNGHDSTATEYIRYRYNRDEVRELDSSIMRTFEELTFSDASEVEVKRENANIDGDSSMGTMLRYGSEGAKKFNLMKLLPKKFGDAHRSGDIHIHDLDFYSLTETCCQIPLDKLFEHGFNTGHGYLREPGEIRSYSALACIAIQANQNDQHGGQSIPMFDIYMAPGVAKTFIKQLVKVVEIKYPEADVKTLKKRLESFRAQNGSIMGKEGLAHVEAVLKELGIEDDRVVIQTIEYTDKETHQAMEAFIHNLNSMHSRAGSQVPFSSINFGTDTSVEGRMVIRNVLKATEEGLGNGETPIFPISIFKLKKGINLENTDPNYDLFQYACKVSAKRLFPNFSNLDVPFNAQYYKEGRPETEVTYMGCRTRVIGNTYDPESEVVTGRGNLSFTSINLPRLGLESRGDIGKFFLMLEERLQLVEKQLLERLRIQSKKRPKNYPFLMGQGVWLGSDKLGPNDDISEILKHGTLSIGFIGLAETLIALKGKHHGESAESQELGLRIVKYMRDFCDRKSAEYRLNFSLIATPAEGLSGRFIGIDQKRYGEIEGITDKNYYTNSFHVPVYYNISVFDKVDIEAPYHALCNAGHITYIEIDGDPSKNLKAFEKIVRYMHDKGIGYGAINHPVDRDPICGYTGIIDDVCPRCGRKEGEPMTEEMWRKIKGYTGNADTLGVTGDFYEEMDRVSNVVSAVD